MTVDTLPALRTASVGERTVGYAEYGDPDGVPALFLHGTPGCRLTRPLDEDLYSRLGLRVLVVDRAGYGASSPLAGRRVVDSVDDLIAVLDSEPPALGGPHQLAVGRGAGARPPLTAGLIPPAAEPRTAAGRVRAARPRPASRGSG